MRIIKKNKKLFIGIVVVAALMAALPIIIAYLIFNSSIGIEQGDSIEEMEDKITSYFEGNGLTEDIINAMRKDPTGDFNVYLLSPNSEDYNKIEDKMGFMLDSVVELNRLETGKKYNLKIYSDFYEGETKISTEELFSKDILGSEDFNIITSTEFMNGGSKRELSLYFIKDNKLLEKLEYYIPSNYNEAGIVNDIDFNTNEDIPFMSFTRGYKVNDRYKTYSPKMNKSKEQIEESISENLSKNEKMVILRLEINEI